MKKIYFLLLVLLPVYALAQRQTLTVNFTELPNNNGKVMVSLFVGKSAYEQRKPLKFGSLDIDKLTARWVVDSIAPGTYIVSAFHDANGNGKMDFSETGMPDEAFGFSNNVTPMMGPPKPEQMLFTVKSGENAVQTIKMLYFGVKEKVLSEVEIVGERKQFVKIDADKISYQVKENATLSSGSMRDAIRKLPGVVLSPSGDLSMNGKPVAIYIDGVPSNLSGADLKNYMESLPANTIEKIELIESPGAAYEANNNGAVANVITRRVPTFDFSGTVNLHYGFSDNHKLSPSLMLNGRKKKINWQLQTGYNWQQQDTHTDMQQLFTSFHPNVISESNTTQKNLNRNVYFRPMLNYRLTDNSYIVFNYSLNASDNQTSNATTRQISHYTTPIHYDSHFNNPIANRNNELVVKYRTTLDSIESSMQITGYYSNFYKESKGMSSQFFDTPIYAISNINLNLDNAYGKMDFEIPLKQVNISLGGKYNITRAHNFGRYNYDGASPLIFTNPTYNKEIDFFYNEQNVAAYAEARKNIGKLSATLGVRWEDLQYKSKVVAPDTLVRGRVSSLFPTVNLLYAINPMVNLSAKYSRKIAMPAYDQLDPNVNGYFDTFGSSTGNQGLKPNFYDNYSLTLTAFNFANIGGYMSYSKNISLLVAEVAEKSLVASKTSADFENVRMYGVYVSLPVPFGLITQGKDFFKKPTNMANMSYAHLFLSCNFNDIKGYVNPNANKRKALWMFNLNTHIALPYKWVLDANWFHMFRGNWQIYTFRKPMNYWQVDVSRKLLKDKLELTAEVMQMPMQSIAFSAPNVQTSFNNRTDGITYWLKLSYRFGSFKGKEETQISVEKRELQGGEINVRK